MEYSKKIDWSNLNNITSNIDIALKNVYERKIPIEDLFSIIKESYDSSYLLINTIKENNIIKSFYKLIKTKLGKKSEIDFHIKQILEIMVIWTFIQKG